MILLTQDREQTRARLIMQEMSPADSKKTTFFFVFKKFILYLPSWIACNEDGHFPKTEFGCFWGGQMGGVNRLGGVKWGG